jgi:acyl-coenzyme A synthetase/AMP-(fatty) acid ligase
LTGAFVGRDFLRRVEKHLAAEIWIGYGASEVANGISSGRVSSTSYVKGYVGTINPSLTLITTGTKEQPGRIVLVNDKDRFARTIHKGKVIAHEGPFFEVADLGYVEGSHLYLVGRADEVYNYSGHIVAYSAIEETIAALAPVSESAVVSGASLGDDLDLVIGVVASDELDLDDLARRLAERLGLVAARPHFKFARVGEIKRNPQSGKIDRQALIRDYQNFAGLLA